MSVRVVSFAPLHNTKGKRDADEFRREARKFAVVHGIGVRTYLFDNALPPEERSAYVRGALAYHQDLDALCLFMHGTKSGVQCGFKGQLGAEQLAASLARFRSLRTIVLYCCSTAADDDKDKADETAPGPGGDGGFADLLRDELLGTFARQVTVYGHSTVGHTSQNPYVRRFDASAGAGGEWVIEPGSPLWPAWKRFLRSSPDGRFRFPWMAQDEIEAELARY